MRKNEWMKLLQKFQDLHCQQKWIRKKSGFPADRRGPPKSGEQTPFYQIFNFHLWEFQTNFIFRGKKLAKLQNNFRYFRRWKGEKRKKKLLVFKILPKNFSKTVELEGTFYWISTSKKNIKEGKKVKFFSPLTFFLVELWIKKLSRFLFAQFRIQHGDFLSVRSRRKNL